MSQEKKWWESSIDAGTISMRLRGAMTAFIPIIVLVAQSKGWDIGEDGLMSIMNVILALVSSVATAVGVAMSVYGYLRRKK